MCGKAAGGRRWFPPTPDIGLLRQKLLSYFHEIWLMLSDEHYPFYSTRPQPRWPMVHPPTARDEPAERDRQHVGAGAMASANIGNIRGGGAC